MTQMKQITVGHSPDADDAFMFYGIQQGAASIPGYEVVHIMQDIQTLNQRALHGELDVTAISTAVYPLVADQYRILACGASVGRRYGPLVVSRKAMSPAELQGKRLGIPGEHTTAYLLAQIHLPDFQPVFLDFDTIMEAVARGEVDAGLIIHEGQVTYQEQGLHSVVDMGEAWFQDTGLPIPLGLDVAHRRLGEALLQQVFEMLHGSILYAHAHEDEAIEYALQFGRGIDATIGKQFVGMYVNEDTRNMGLEGLHALETLYHKAHQRGITTVIPPLDIVGLEEA